MKYLVLPIVLVLMACGKNGGQSCQSTGTALENGQTVNLVNGTCSMSSETIWQNPAYTELIVCNKAYTTLNGQVCQIDPTQITNQTTGCLAMSDGYQIFPSADGKTDCWVNITNGQINGGAQEPTQL